MDGFMDPPSVEFRNAEGNGRWCISPDTPGLLADSVYRACRDNLLSDGYREIGPWCGGAAPTSGDSLGAFLFGGFMGVATVNARAAQYEACQQRQAAQSEGGAAPGETTAAAPRP